MNTREIESLRELVYAQGEAIDKMLAGVTRLAELVAVLAKDYANRKRVN